MHSSQWYRNIIYSKNLEELENQWKIAKNNNFGDEYHYVYYCLAKNRLTKNKNILTQSTSNKYKNMFNSNNNNNKNNKNNSNSNYSNSIIRNGQLNKNIYRYFDNDKTKKRKPLQIKNEFRSINKKSTQFFLFPI